MRYNCGLRTCIVVRQEVASGGCHSCRMERNSEAYCQQCAGAYESEVRNAGRRCDSLYRSEHFTRIIEVGDEVYEAFKESGFDMSLISVKKRKTGKYHIDLWEANRIELLNAGVPAEQIEVAGICSYIIMMNSSPHVDWA